MRTRNGSRDQYRPSCSGRTLVRRSGRRGDRIRTAPPDCDGAANHFFWFPLPGYRPDGARLWRTRAPVAESVYLFSQTGYSWVMAILAGCQRDVQPAIAATLNYLTKRSFLRVLPTQSIAGNARPRMVFSHRFFDAGFNGRRT